MTTDGREVELRDSIFGAVSGFEVEICLLIRTILFEEEEGVNGLTALGVDGLGEGVDLTGVEGREKEVDGLKEELLERKDELDDLKEDPLDLKDEPVAPNFAA